MSGVAAVWARLMRARRRLFAALRVLVVVLAFQLVLGVWLGRAASARGAEALDLLGATLLHIPHVRSSPAGALTVNGVEFAITTARSERSLDEVLAEARSACAERSALTLPEPARSRLGQARTGLERWLAPDGVLHAQTSAAGVVACLDRGERRPLHLEELTRALQRFVETGELEQLGRLHYVRAERVADGSTFVVGVTTQGRASLWAMFPSAGDAPGGELPNIPRPPAARRLLSAAPRGARAALNAYVTAEPAATLLPWYRSQLAARGWTVDSAPAEPRVIAARRAGVHAVLAFSSGVHGESTVTIALL